MSSELVALNSNWLETTTTVDAYSNSSNATIWYSGQCWPPYAHSWLTFTSDPKPIKLGYSEVERLRQAAKRDAKLKKILQKFTDLIEVVVDFE